MIDIRRERGPGVPSRADAIGCVLAERDELLAACVAARDWVSEPAISVLLHQVIAKVTE